MPGEAITIWSVRIALLFYVTALAFWLGSRTPSARQRARLAWTAGCLFYLIHVYAAFRHFHEWSHGAAYRETARQTEELFDLNWGGGLYFNYLFTVVWFGDVLWWWRSASSYELRPQWISAAIHAFLAFLFFNGAVVFASGFSRWVGVAAVPVLVGLWWKSRRPAGGS